jgi:DNA-directed RNA polymerase sigma subunit (sigma70/sigma32)
MAPRSAREPVPDPSDSAAVWALAKEAKRQSHPGPEEHTRLLSAAAEGDRQAQDRLLRAHLDWVAAEADERRASELDEADLFQEGSIGLMEAIAAYGSRPGGGFEAFCRARISARMDAALTEERAALREGQLLIKAAEDYERVEIELRRQMGRPATLAELAEKLEWTQPRTEEIGRVVQDARRRHDEEVIQFLDPADTDEPLGPDDLVDGEGRPGRNGDPPGDA